MRALMPPVLHGTASGVLVFTPGPVCWKVLKRVQHVQ